MTLGSLSRPFARIAAVLMIGTAVSACSSVPDWVDPTSWIGDDSASSDTASADEGLPADQQPNQQIDDQSGTASADQQPDLAAIPDRPDASSSAEEREQVAESLDADRSRSHYSSEQLRGDTPQSTAPTADTEAPQPAPAQVAQTSPDEDTDTNAAAPASPARRPMPGRVAMASTAPQSTTDSTGPAVPPNSTGIVGAQGPMTTDAALGFQPSKAPPLDSSVAQFVPQPILSRYVQTAAVGSSSGVSAPAVPASAAPAMDSNSGMGGPEAMTGAVVANLDALQSAPVQQASVYANPAGLPPAQVVFFPHDTTILNAEGRQLVRAAADAYRSKGGSGFVRVVGHSSSRTANMPLARHLTYNFERSQARATAVAKELIRDGVPADKVLVEAVGDSQPVYYESMPQGEEGNRRAEIFLQS